MFSLAGALDCWIAYGLTVLMEFFCPKSRIENGEGIMSLSSLNFFTLFTAFVCASQTIALGDVIKTFFVIGDSNAVARGADYSELSAELTAARADIYYNYRLDGSNSYSSGSTVGALQPNVGWYPNSSVPLGFGPDLAAGHRLADILGEPIALIKNGRGSATAAVEFAPGNLEFNASLAQYTIVQSHLASLGHTASPAAMLLMLGLNDALVPSYVAGFESNISNIISAYRTNLNAPNLEVYMLEPFGGDEPVFPLLQALQNIQAADPRAHVLPISHYAQLRADGVHYDTTTLLRIGSEFATSAVPEPSTFSLASLGILILVQSYHRHKTRCNIQQMK